MWVASHASPTANAVTLTFPMTLPTTMRAIQLAAVGQPLIDAELPVPEPGPGEALLRIRAAGICHSDAHYRSGGVSAGPLPLTLGHEMAGEVAALGPGEQSLELGDRVALHYLLTCGSCRDCSNGQEQLCHQARMIGKHLHGGFADYIAVPARNCVPLPAGLPWEQGAVLMCACATALHALRRARLQPGETVAIFGLGGLGLAAVQLAATCNPSKVFAVDLQPEKLALAARYGALPVDAGKSDVPAELRRLTAGRGVDVALEFIGHQDTILQALHALAPGGRAAIAGISGQPVPVDTYRDLIGREALLIGVSDHTLAELADLLEIVAEGSLDPGVLVTGSVPLDAAAINRTLDDLDRGSAGVRTVIVN